MSDNDITKMKVADLKKELKARGLSVMGNKNELVDRLQSALLDGGDVLEDTANSEDLLEDDDLNDDLLDEDKDLTDPVGEEEQILKSPTPSETSKSISPEQQPKPSSTGEDAKGSDTKGAVPTAAQRKICLKRNVSITRPPIVSDSPATSTEEPKAQRQQHQSGNSSANSGSDGEPEKKVVKLGQLSALERLEMRAKKFGAQTTTASAASVSASGAAAGGTPSTGSGTNEKLQARAARFGLSASNTTTNTSTSSKITSSGETPSLDALKKRAERFGGSVSSKMSKLEQEEKLAKRQARFAQTASSTAANGAEKVSVGSVDYAEKARLRLERFKSAA